MEEDTVSIYGELGNDICLVTHKNIVHQPPLKI